ncbi:MAG: hypothetical protein ACFE8E_01895 [Candidatus Hodarchaeota archaeon]
MCEFKIISKNDGSQILEDIVILSYNENYELNCKDVLGIGESLKSTLILNVNTLNQTCIVLEHPIIQDFLKLVNDINNRSITKVQIDDFQNQLDKIKATI